jgi:hypothetical protein
VSLEQRTVWCVILSLALACAGAETEVTLGGRVVSDTGAPVSGARLTIAPASAAATRRVMLTDPAGAFSCRLPTAGGYSIDVEREGFFTLKGRSVHLAAGPNEIQFVLNPLREVFESLEVSASAGTVSLDQAAPAKSLHGTDILAIPYPTTNNLKNALRIVPGVVQDSVGGIHVNGGGEEQTLYTLDGFTVNDPLTGRLESRVSVESVQSIEFSSGAFASGYGKASGGVMAISTVAGSDRPHYSATNFVPGIENHKGLVIGDWTPRAGISGPLRKGRAWFSDSLALQYQNHVVDDLPAGGDRTSDWRVSNLLHTQFNLTPSHILFGGFLLNYWNAPRTGLSALSPMETTTDRRSRQWFFHVKDQVYLRRGAVVEAGYAANRTFSREIPQGNGLLILTPDGKIGNNFIDGMRKGSRDQIILTAILPSLRLAGAHLVKTGIESERVAYWQDVSRTGYVHQRADSTPYLQVLFAGNGRLGIHNHEAAWYLQDAWKPRESLLLEAGLRVDWNRLVGATAAAPAFGVAWSPGGRRQAKLFGGVSVIRESPPLKIFARPLDQVPVATYFSTGGALVRGPAVSTYALAPPYQMPRYQVATLGYERRTVAGWQVRLTATRKRGRLGLAYRNLAGTGEPVPGGIAEQFGANSMDAYYVLGNHRLDAYDALEITFRRPLRRQYEWMASYTRSRSRSNSVADLSADDPFLYPDNFGPMPWDAPHRLLSWGYLPTWWENWALAYLLETRNGFPFSVYSSEGHSVGALNSRRYPAFFELNLHAERRFRFRGQRWALRAGFNNITNHRNPNAVNSNVDSARFLQFYGGQHRSLNFRLRWLGRQ